MCACVCDPRVIVWMTRVISTSTEEKGGVEVKTLLLNCILALSICVSVHTWMCLLFVRCVCVCVCLLLLLYVCIVISVLFPS